MTEPLLHTNAPFPIRGPPSYLPTTKPFSSSFLQTIHTQCHGTQR